jgi:hypothetical protein
LTVLVKGRGADDPALGIEDRKTPIPSGATSPLCQLPFQGDKLLLLEMIETECLRLVPLSPPRLSIGPVQIAEAADLFKQMFKGFRFFPPDAALRAA